MSAPTPAAPTARLPPPGKSQAGKGETARARILDAAEAAFADLGFAGASLRTIGTAIGMGNAALLHHYPDKRRLYAAVLTRIAAELEVALLPPNQAEDLHRIAAAWLDWNLARPRAATLILRELLDNAARAERARSWPMQPLMRRVAAAARASARGAAAREDPMILAFQVIGAVAYICAGQRSIAAIMETEPAQVVSRLRAALRMQVDALTGATDPAWPTPAQPPREE